MKKNIIFDFDGTICDSFEASLEIAQYLVNHESLMDPKEVERFRHMTLPAVARELKVPTYRLFWLIFQGRKLLGQKLDKLKLFPDMDLVITELKKSGCNLYIMSSNSESNIRYFLDRFELTHNFSIIYGSVGYFSKASKLKQIMKSNKLESADCLYVGDEQRDMFAAIKAGVSHMAVAWGFNTPDMLVKSDPDGIIAVDPKELLSLIMTKF